MSTSNAPSKELAPSSSRMLTMEAIVGFFVAIVFLALAIFTIVVSGSTLFNKKLYPITVLLPDAMGLRRNDPVIARGTTVGAVERVYYDADGVHIEAMLDAPVTFYEGYDITVVSTSILGGRQLVLTEGDPTGPKVTDTRRLVGSRPADLFDDATAIVSHVSKGEGTLGKILYDEAMASNLVAIIANFRAISSDISNFTASVQSGQGVIGHLAYDNHLTEDLTSAVADVRAIAANLSNMTAQVQSGEGTLGRLVYDTQLSDDLSSVVSSLKTVAGRLEKGEGTLGKLLSAEDTAMYDDLASAIASLKAIAGRLESGEGSLGKLLSDDEMYNNLNGLLKDGREVIDDMREASPVSTVSDVMFGAF